MRAQGVSHLLLMTEFGFVCVFWGRKEHGMLIRFGFWQRWMPEEGENAFGWERMRGPLDRVRWESLEDGVVVEKTTR